MDVKLGIAQEVPKKHKEKTVKLQELFIVVNTCLQVHSVYEALLCL